MNKNDDNNKRIAAVMQKYGFKDIGRTWGDKPGIFRGYLDHVFVNQAYAQEKGLTIPGNVTGLYA
jgi:hypothetical protein